MSSENPTNSRSALFTLALLVFVLASGVSGMLLARHFHRPSAAVEAPSPEVGTPVPQSRPSPLGMAAPEPSAPAGSSTRQAGGSSYGSAAPAPLLSAGELAHTSGYVEEDDEIQLVLHRWQQALLSNNAEQIAASYSTSIRRFFLQTDVNRGYVREYMKSEEARGSRLTSYQLQHVSIEHVGHNAVDVHFVASFAVDTPAGERTGNARTLLKLHREDGDWKIYFERDYNS